jgi:hypothetical protein
MIAQPLLHDPQEGVCKLPERRRLSFQTVDFRLHCFGQHGMGSVPTKLSELVFEMLLSLSRNISPLLFLLKGRYEPAGCAHPNVPSEANW